MNHQEVFVDFFYSVFQSGKQKTVPSNVEIRIVTLWKMKNSENATKQVGAGPESQLQMGLRQ